MVKYIITAKARDAILADLKDHIQETQITGAIIYVLEHLPVLPETPRTQDPHVRNVIGGWKKSWSVRLSSRAEAALVERFEKHLAEAERRLKVIKQACGYVGNGSATTLKISQDDATGGWFMEAGKAEAYSEYGFLNLIDEFDKKYMEDEHGELVPRQGAKP